MTNTITDYYNGALLSEAAYADFTEAMTKPLGEQRDAAIKAALTAINFSDTQAQAFVEKYTVASYVGNDEVGFSGTVFQEISTNKYITSFRGTEASDDFTNDILIADVAGIVVKGYADYQIISAYNYMQELLTPAGQDVVQIKKYETTLTNETMTPPSGAYDVKITEVTDGLDTVTTYSYYMRETIPAANREALPYSGILANNTSGLDLVGHSLGGHLAAA